MKNLYSKILVVSDFHAPANHKNAISFYKKIKKIYNPTYTICIGDLVDLASIQVERPTDPNLDSPKLELNKARLEIRKLQDVFPNLDILIGNHDLRVKRRAERFGIPADFLQDFNNLFEITANWKWYEKKVITLPNGNDCFFVHHFKSNYLLAAQSLGCSMVCGHTHTQAGVSYYSTPTNLHFAATTGCTIDTKHEAFKYQKTYIKRPILSCLSITDSVPHIVPMHLDRNSSWTKTIVI